MEPFPPQRAERAEGIIWGGKDAGDVFPDHDARAKDIGEFHEMFCEVAVIGT
jgi:hypothetical protein